MYLVVSQQNKQTHLPIPENEVLIKRLFMKIYAGIFYLVKMSDSKQFKALKNPICAYKPASAVLDEYHLLKISNWNFDGI